MAKLKYSVKVMLWSPSGNRYIQPGEVIELDDDIALLLLKKDVIEPAQRSRKLLTNYEVKDDTDNQ